MKRNFRWASNVVRDLDPQLEENDDGFKIACLLLLSTEIGPNIKKLARATPYTREFISGVSKNLRKNGIWSGKYVDFNEWKDPETGGVAFWMHVNAGLGYIQRVPIR